MKDHLVLAALAASLAVSVATPAVAADAQDRADAPVDASSAQGSDDQPSGDIIVTGTRRADVRAIESATPIQLFSAEALQKSGQPNLLDAMSRLIPAFNMESFGGDTGNLTLGAQLRGLSPNQVLILVNGKRRHMSANLKATGGALQGSTPVDLGLIPAAAIARIEVLQDGAAAQYGSDAIAGVINLILKNDASGGSVSVTGGQYYKGDGETVDAAANIGLPLGSAGFVNLTAEYRFHDYSSRSGPDPRILTGNPNRGRLYGDARNQPTNLSLNAGYDLGGARLYGFGTYSHRAASSNQTYQLPTVAPALYPDGFIPREALAEDDFSITAGVQGGSLETLRWDIGSTYGADYNRIDVENSVNTALLTATGASPTRFRAGNFAASQWTTNAEFGKAVDVGLAAPLNLLLGAEFRRDSYKLTAGDAASRFGAGPKGYAGFALTNASDNSRNSVGAYADVAAQLTSAWQVDVAGRYEHYDDAGDTVVGKVTTRYDVSPAFAVRGTASTGFRAPTLAEQFFATTNVQVGLAILQLPANSAAAASLGAKPLSPEKSTNLSLGFVIRPVAGLDITVDAYQIRIRDRILNTGYLTGAGVANAIALTGAVLDPNAFGLAQFFTNAADTRTRGLDITARYPIRLGAAGTIDATVGVNLNKTKVTHIDAPPPQLAGRTLFDIAAQSSLTQTSPRNKIILGADYRIGAFSLLLRQSFYGRQQLVSADPNTGGLPYYTNVNRPKGITDIEAGYDISSRFHLAAGANNLFNTYPDATIPASRYLNNNVTFAAAPYGFNGGYYYARATLKL